MKEYVVHLDTLKKNLVGQYLREEDYRERYYYNR